MGNIRKSESNLIMLILETRAYYKGSKIPQTVIFCSFGSADHSRLLLKLSPKPPYWYDGCYHNLSFNST